MRTRLIKFIALPVGGLLAFFLFLGLTFPDERVQVLVQRKIEAGLDYKYRVDMVEFDFGIFSGIEMTDVSLMPRFEFDNKLPPGAKNAMALPTDPEPAAADGDEPVQFCPEISEPLPVMIESISVDPSITALLGGGLAATFDVQVGGGSLTGELEQDSGGTSIQAEIKDVLLQRFTLLGNMTEVGTKGYANATIDLSLDASGAPSTGSIDLGFSNVTVCSILIDPKTAFSLPVMHVGDITGSIEFGEDGRLEFKEVESDGDDVDLAVMGSVQLAGENRPKTSMNLRVKLTPTDEWLQKNSLGILESQCQRGPDGSFTFLFQGVSGQMKRECVRNRGGGGAAPTNFRNQPPKRTGDATPAPPVAPEPEPMVEEVAPPPTRSAQPKLETKPRAYEASKLRKMGVKPVQYDERTKSRLKNVYKRR